MSTIIRFSLDIFTELHTCNNCFETSDRVYFIYVCLCVCMHCTKRYTVPFFYFICKWSYSSFSPFDSLRAAQTTATTNKETYRDERDEEEEDLYTV